MLYSTINNMLYSKCQWNSRLGHLPELNVHLCQTYVTTDNGIKSNLEKYYSLLVQEYKLCEDQAVQAEFGIPPAQYSCRFKCMQFAIAGVRIVESNSVASSFIQHEREHVVK